MTIPVENIYYLLLYAWNRLEEHEIVAVRPDGSTDLLNLLARVLVSGVNHLQRRGLDREYIRREERIPGIRCKLEVSASIKQLAFPMATAVCSFDELSYDVIQNQIIRSTMGSLIRMPEVDNSLRNELAGIHRKLDEVSEIEVTADSYRAVRLHRNNAFYGFLLQVCRFIQENSFPSEESGEMLFRDVIRDRLPAIFEDFVRNFYERETVWRTGRMKFKWQNVEADDYDLALLPNLNTDVTLEHDSEVIVIDTKYYKNTLAEVYGKEVVHPANLYQLYAYIRNLDLLCPGKRVGGMLLYPTVQRELDLTYTIHGYAIHVRTVNLMQPWQKIADRLQSLAPLPVLV
ncbi:MAG: hypothetical protein KDB68_14450 [Planctomycetes bacterium]|nr:hypothetical protein [Planctomycetota bacterium]MCA8947646.1 hypothetical protein [Planctomycetota bacterium]